MGTTPDVADQAFENRSKASSDLCRQRHFGNRGAGCMQPRGHRSARASRHFRHRGQSAPPQRTLRSITALDPNVEEQGYQGAAMLDRLMAGKPVPQEPIWISPARVITRQSTEITAVTHPGVAKAVRFIADNLEK